MWTRLITDRHLRIILYDHLFTRRTKELDYSEASPEDLKWIKRYYDLNKNVILGVGAVKSGIWLTHPEVKLPV